MINVNDLRAGAAFQEEGNLFEALEYSHTKMGRGTATIRIKARNLRTGAITDKTFISGARVEDAQLDKINGQFLYSDEASSSFMDPVTFEQFTIPLRILTGSEKYLQEGKEYQLLAFGDEVLKVDLPRTVELKVVDSPPGVRGDTVSNVYKAAKLENGLEVKVPLFINEGDIVKVDTRSGEYMERVRS